MIHPKYVTDEAGNRIGVYLDMKDFMLMLGEIENSRDVREAEAIIEQKGETFTLEEIKKKYLGKK